MNIEEVSQMISHLQKVEKEIEELEEKLKLKKAELLRFSSQVIPDMFLEAGVDELKTLDGKKVSIKKVYYASIPEKSAQEAYVWLRNNGYGELIKNAVVARFSSSPADQLGKEIFIRQCQEDDIEYTEKNEIHHQTLKAWVKEMVESQKEFPQNLFGVFESKQTVVK